MRKRTDELPPDFLPGIRTDLLIESNRIAKENLAKLHRAGVTIGYGTDTSFCYGLHGAPYYELSEMTKAGMSNGAALTAATLGSAKALGREELGRIRVGGQADLLVLDGDPVADLEVLRFPKAVIRGGRMVEDKPGLPSQKRTLGTLISLVKALYF